jgi:hypothetical protein
MGDVWGVHPPYDSKVPLFPREFSIKQCHNSALNYRNTPSAEVQVPPFSFEVSMKDQNSVSKRRSFLFLVRRLHSYETVSTV